MTDARRREIAERPSLTDLLVTLVRGDEGERFAARGEIFAQFAELQAGCASRDQEIARLKILADTAESTRNIAINRAERLSTANEALEREVARLKAFETEAEELLVFLDDSFSGEEEIRFVAVRDGPIVDRTETHGSTTTVYVDKPPSINEFGDMERPHETLSDALKDWYGRDAVKPAPRADQGAEPKTATTEPTDTQRLDWWFAHGMEDSVCDGSVDLWWVDDEAPDIDTAQRVTHGTSVRDTIDRAMRGEYESD